MGAGIGANARYWLGGWIHGKYLTPFPWGTFVVNVSGCVGIGLAMGWLGTAQTSAPWRLLIVVGLLGGYTTFSSFSWETLRLIEARNFTTALVYVLGSCLAGLVGTFLGAALSRAATAI